MKVMAVAVAFGAQIIIWAVHALIAVTILEGPLSASITVNAFWASPSIMFWMHLMTFAMAFKTQVEVWTFEALVALIRGKVFPTTAVAEDAWQVPGVMLWM